MVYLYGILSHLRHLRFCWCSFINTAHKSGKEGEFNMNCTHLRIDNSRRGAVHVVWNFSRTMKATTSCDSSNESAYFSTCVDVNGILIN